MRAENSWINYLVALRTN